MRFAYLILAHDNFKLLQRLVDLLDDPRNDIYVHFDRKVKELPALTANKSRLVYVSGRIDVRWGTVSQLKAIFSSLEEAFSNGPYDYYHLISGTHLPLKNQDYIHNHFSSFQGTSVLRLWEPDEGDADFKLRRIHWAISKFQSKNPKTRFLVQRFWTLNMFIQKRLGIRINKESSFLKADEWASIAHTTAEFLLTHQKVILRKYRHSFCCDEYYLASEMKAAGISFADDPFLLYVTFEKDHPKTLGKDNFESLSKSEFIFARKFDDSLTL